MRGPVLVSSDKGGVGKSATVVHLAAVAAEDGHRVLVVDGDPRATSTTWLDACRDHGLNEVLRVQDDDLEPAAPGDLLHDLIVPSGELWPGSVDVLPATRALANRNGDNSPGLTYRLAQGLQALEGRYDLVLLDAPGAVGGTLVQALFIAARLVVVPTLLDSGGASGVAGTLRTMHLMQAAVPELSLVGITVAMHERRLTRDAAFHLEELRSTHTTRLLPPDTWLLKRTVSRQAQSARAPITAYGGANTDIVAPARRLLSHLQGA
jgi:chromosome partitioning protein